MKLHFYVRFHTTVGQSLSVMGNLEELGNNGLAAAVRMQYLNAEFWETTVEVDPSNAALVHYKYVLHYFDEHPVIEWGNDRKVDISKLEMEEMQLVDTWNHAGEFENAFYTSPFQQTLLKDNETKTNIKTPKSFTDIFKIKAPLLQKNEVACLSGSALALGDWKSDEVVLMNREGNWWTAKVNIPNESFPLQYKYGIYNTKEKSFIRYEDGSNRFLFGDAIPNKVTVIHDGFIHLPNTTWKGTGVAIPVFSLRSKESFGVGEFADLKLLVD